MEWDFEAEVWLWKSDARVALSHASTGCSDEIEDMPMSRGGFGSIRVEVTIGSSTWGTSIFPSKEMSSFLLPLKKPGACCRRAGCGGRVSRPPADRRLAGASSFSF